MTNFFPGLARGPIDHEASSVINAVSNDTITMGSAVKLFATIPIDQLLPQVVQKTVTPALIDFFYGIAVGGDIDGIYGDGKNATDDTTRAAAAGDGVVVVTQGRCLARVDTTVEIKIGDALSAATTNPGVDDGGVLKTAQPTENGQVIARALQAVSATPSPDNLSIIAVDVQREGTFT